jgi:hypothetical protein
LWKTSMISIRAHAIVYSYNKTPSDLLMLFQILFSFITTLSGLQPTSFVNIQRSLATH